MSTSEPIPLRCTLLVGFSYFVPFTNMAISDTATGKRPEASEKGSLRWKPPRIPCVFTFRTVLYGMTFGLLFAITVALLGLVCFELHRYGDSYANYGSMQYKHAIGLLLFACIMSLLIILSHPLLGVGFVAFCALIAAIFFGTGAGVINRTTPYKGSFCASRPASQYPPAWQPYARECGRVVAIQGLAWALWALYIFLMVGALIHKLEIRTRPTPEGFYFSKHQ